MWQIVVLRVERFQKSPHLENCVEVNKSVCTCGNNKWRFHKGFPVFVMIFYWVASCLTFQQLFIPYAHTCSSESMWFAMYNNLFFFVTRYPLDFHTGWPARGHPLAFTVSRPQGWDAFATTATGISQGVQWDLWESASKIYTGGKHICIEHPDTRIMWLIMAK